MVNAIGAGTASPESDAATPKADPPSSTAKITTTALAPAAVPEGGSATFTVKLAAAPTADVILAIANRGTSNDDADLTASPASLRFTPANWNIAQTVRIAAVPDTDVANGSAVFTFTAYSSDADFNNIRRTLTATENDSSMGITASSATVTVPEGDVAAYTLVLNAPPTHAVTVAIAKAAGGDPNIGVRPASLVFTADSWDIPRTVSLLAAEDGDIAEAAPPSPTPPAASMPTTTVSASPASPPPKPTTTWGQRCSPPRASP